MTSQGEGLTREQCIEWLAAHVFTEGRVPSKDVAGLLNRDVFPAILAHLRTPPTGKCVCGEPSIPNAVHRTDGPCYQADCQPTGITESERKDAARFRWCQDNPMQAQALLWNHQSRKARAKLIDEAIAAEALCAKLGGSHE